MIRSPSEKAWYRRRCENGMYKGEYATAYIQTHVQHITGLHESIIACDETTPLQLFIDTIAETLDAQYHALPLSRDENLSEILLDMGFKRELLQSLDAFDQDYGWHMTFTDIIESIFNFVLHDIVQEPTVRGRSPQQLTTVSIEDAHCSLVPCNNLPFR